MHHITVKTTILEIFVPVVGLVGGCSSAVLTFLTDLTFLDILIHVVVYPILSGIMTALASFLFLRFLKAKFPDSKPVNKSKSGINNSKRKLPSKK